jgi:hypothetical protein
VALAVADRYGICPVDLDVFYWRAAQVAERDLVALTALKDGKVGSLHFQ